MAATLTRAVLVFPLVATLLAAAPAVAQTKTPPRAAAKRLFAEKVFPLLKARCFALAIIPQREGCGRPKAGWDLSCRQETSGWTKI